VFQCSQGSVAIAGAAIRWLRDNLAIINSSEESGMQLLIFTEYLI